MSTNTKAIRAIVINPHTKTITKTMIPGDSDYTSKYEGLRDVIFMGQLRRGYLEHIDAGISHGLYIDEEGMFVQDQAFFELGNLQIGGIAVLVFDTADGDIDDCLLEVSLIEDRITWIEPAQVMEPEVKLLPWDDTRPCYESEAVMIVFVD